MSTHAAALGISGAAYLYARRHSGNDAFSFGTGKFGDLAAFTSAVVLGISRPPLPTTGLPTLNGPIEYSLFA
jgi:hypothetical protein